MKRGRFVYYRSPGFEADLLRHHLSGQIRILPTAMETIPFYILFYQRTSLPGWPCSPMPCNGWQTAASWLTWPSATLKPPSHRAASECSAPSPTFVMIHNNLFGRMAIKTR